MKVRRTLAALVSIMLVILPISSGILLAAEPAPVGTETRTSRDIPGAAPPATATPAYFLDRETAFMIKYAVDATYGGIYTAVDANGGTLGIIPESVWGFPASSIRGTDKSGVGQSTCMRYFITEYQRVTISNSGIGGINTALTSNPGPAIQLTSPIDLLNFGRACGDYIINHLEIPQPQPAGIALPNRLYYWAFNNQQGNATTIGPGGLGEDTAPGTQNSAARSESIIAWSLAELGLALKKAGLPASVWQPYQDGALRWWNWRQTIATALPPYGNPALPASFGPCGAPTNNPDNCIPGIGRDIFYPALGFTLTELTGNLLFRDGNGTNNADGTAFGAIPFANRILGTGNVPRFSLGPNFAVSSDALQEQAYGPGFGRAIIFAKHSQQNIGPLTDRDQWWDFGNYPARLNRPTLNPAGNPELSLANLGLPFAHFKGRELVAGTQRAIWFYYTFGEDPNIYYRGTFNATNTRQAILDYWNYSITYLWDDTIGQQAWFEARGFPYKPCFAGGTDIPIGDWRPPVIGNKVHRVNTDGSATITVVNAVDLDMSYLNWNLKATGITNVDVVYTDDNGVTWKVLPTTPSGGNNYFATIPPQPVNRTIYYYARARDFFNNQTAFPAGAEVWGTDGVSQGKFKSLAQFYTVLPPNTPEPTTTPTTMPAFGTLTPEVSRSPGAFTAIPTGSITPSPTGSASALPGTPGAGTPGGDTPTPGSGSDTPAPTSTDGSSSGGGSGTTPVTSGSATPGVGTPTPLPGFPNTGRAPAGEIGSNLLGWLLLTGGLVMIVMALGFGRFAAQRFGWLKRRRDR